MKINKTSNRFNYLASTGWLVMLFLVIQSSCQSGGMIEKSDSWARIQFGEYMVENNTWNEQAATSKWIETIFYDTIQGNMGWKWDFSDENDNPEAYVVKSFPEIIFGKKPYEGYSSTTPRLPTELSSARFSIDYEYHAEATGIYNTSTDITLTDSRNPGQENIRAKLMIWFDHQNMPFFTSEKLKLIVVNGEEYLVFADTTHTGPEGRWTYIALLPTDFPKKGKLRLEEFFDYFLAEGILNPEWYLSSIEIGSEIAAGKGEITFKRFIIH